MGKGEERSMNELRKQNWTTIWQRNAIFLLKSLCKLHCVQPQGHPCHTDYLSLLWKQWLSTSGLPKLLSPLASLMERWNKIRSENWAFQCRWMMSVLQVNFLLADSLSSCLQSKPVVLYRCSSQSIFSIKGETDWWTLLTQLTVAIPGLFPFSK